jgi:hypothetical protein
MRIGMRTAICVAFVLSWVCSLNAQITATLNVASDGMEMVKIRNDSAASLAAFVVTVKRLPLSGNSSHAPSVVYSDPLIDAEATPLPAGEERNVMAQRFVGPGGKPRRMLADPTIAAGIFADGSTTGDAVLLTRLLFRRSSMLMAVETTFETLSEAGNRNVPREQLIKQFRRLAESVHRWYLPTELQIGHSLYQSMVGKLMNLPQGPIGSAFPPSDFVAQETATLHRQRVSLLESQPSLADAAFVQTLISDVKRRQLK